MSLTEKDVVFTVEALPEEASAHAELEAPDYAWVKREEKRGNEWAWCVVKVTATAQHPNGVDTLEGTDYLGMCMYKSREDFIKGGYFEDMKAYALAEVNAKWEAAMAGVRG